MRVCLISVGASEEKVMPHLVIQARLLRERGDRVQLILPTESYQLPPDLAGFVASSEPPLPQSDVYIYHDAGDCPLPPSLCQHDSGLVLIHDHRVLSSPRNAYAGGGGLLLAHYADLMLVDDAARRDQLLQNYDLPQERVHLLPGIDEESAYRTSLGGLVDRAIADDWPPAPVPAISLGRSEAETPSPMILRNSLVLAQRQADVMLRTYRVRSQIPILGGLVAWARRNLTSHLREPYLDPTLERQVAFNRTVVAWMEQIQARLEALESDLGRLQAPPPKAGGDDRSEAEW